MDTFRPPTQTSGGYSLVRSLIATLGHGTWLLTLRLGHSRGTKFQRVLAGRGWSANSVHVDACFRTVHVVSCLFSLSAAPDVSTVMIVACGTNQKNNETSNYAIWHAAMELELKISCSNHLLPIGNLPGMNCGSKAEGHIRPFVFPFVGRSVRQQLNYAPTRPKEFNHHLLLSSLNSADGTILPALAVSHRSHLNVPIPKSCIRGSAQGFAIVDCSRQGFSIEFCAAAIIW